MDANSNSSIAILSITDDKADQRAIAQLIEESGLQGELTLASNLAEGRASLAETSFDVVLVDLELPDGTGIELFDHPLEASVVVIGPPASDRLAVHAMLAGAENYLVRETAGEHLAILPVVIRSCMARKHGEAWAQRRVEELRRSNAELHSFAHLVAHDLRGPLRAIQSFTVFLQEDLQGTLAEEPEALLSRVATGTSRMGELIDDLLEYSSLGREPRIERVDLSETLQGVLDDPGIRSLAADGEIVVDGELPVVEADSTLLTSVLSELIENALKFRSDGKPQVKIGAELRDTGWEFHISDNGIGIRKEKQLAVFGMLERLHPKAEFVGNGIGLALCRKIVEQHGGRIWIDPSPSCGTTVRFFLPRAFSWDSKKAASSRVQTAS